MPNKKQESHIHWKTIHNILNYNWSATVIVWHVVALLCVACGGTDMFHVMALTCVHVVTLTCVPCDGTDLCSMCVMLWH